MSLGALSSFPGSDVQDEDHRGRDDFRRDRECDPIAGRSLLFCSNALDGLRTLGPG